MLKYCVTWNELGAFFVIRDHRMKINWFPFRPATRLVALLVTFALHGCGGGSGDRPPTTPDGDLGTGTPTLPPSTLAPTIGEQPSSTIVSARQTAHFQVMPRDDVPVAYQWQRNGVDIPGATRFTYQAVAQSSDTGARYQARLSNAAGSVTSEAAVLTVLDAPTGMLSLLAGAIGGVGNLDGTGAAARFDGMSGLGIDAAGNVLVADGDDFGAGGGVRRVTPQGVVSTLDRGPRGATGIATDPAGNIYTTVPGRNAALYRLTPDRSAQSPATPLLSHNPVAIALDAAGQLIVADDTTIRRIDPASGQSTVLAGGSTASPPQSVKVCALAVDAAGHIVFTDAFANTVRRLGPDGTITTVVPASAGLQRPCGLAIDSLGSLLVSDSGNAVIRKITPSGAVSVIAGAIGSSGMRDGSAADARFTAPNRLALAPNGDLYIADNHTLRRLDAAGNVMTIAGLAGPTGPAFGPYHATDGTGNVYVAVQTSVARDSDYSLQKIAPTGSATTLASGLHDPQGVALDDADNVYIADRRSNCVGGQSDCVPYGLVLKFDAARSSLGVLAGSSPASASPGGSDVDGGATDTRFRADLGALAVDAAGDVYVGQTSSIRKVSRGGVVRTFTTKTGAVGLAVDRSGSNAVYAAACTGVAGVGQVFSFGQLSRIDPSGNLTVLGDAGQGADPTNAEAQAAKNACPAGIALDPAGNLFIAYPGLHNVRKRTPAGVGTTIAGQLSRRGITLGPLPATLLSPTDVSFGPAGNLIIGSTQALLQARFDK